MTLEAGQMLASYRLVERIGEGGMGEVWKALDTDLGRHIALKLLPEEMAAVPERLRRFEREAKAVAALNHPNIVTIHSVERARGVRFITMELVEGESLSEVIAGEGLPLGRFFDLAVPLTDALQAAHERGIIHRDLKPGNVMLTRDGRLKVLDFGLAKLVETSTADDATQLDTRSELTQVGRVMGTVPYMSPEQLQGRPLDSRTDLFSLGVILYEMATGVRPFRGTSSVELMSSILRDTPRSVAEVRVGLPDQLGQIVRRCLEKEIERRYQTATEVRIALGSLRDEVTTGTAARTAIPSRRIRPLLVMAIVVGLLLAAAAFFASRRQVPDRAGLSAVAVLPFENLTGDPDQDYLSHGVGSGLITQLSEISGVRLVGRPADGEGGDASRWAKQLGISAVLGGQIRRDGERLRVAVALTDIATGLELWSGEFGCHVQELFALQKEIAREVASVLAIPLTRRELQRLARDPTRSFKAYDYFLRGYRLLDRFADLRAVSSAEAMFRQALRLDPEFALAHVGLSKALWSRYLLQQTVELLVEAEKEARRALEIDPGLPAAQVALARVYRSTGRYSESIDELRRVLANHPKPDEALRELAASYEQVGDLKQAEACLEQAAALGGEDWFNWNVLGVFLEGLGRYDEAREAWQQASALATEGISLPDANLAALTILQGRFDEAIQIYERIPGPVGDAVTASNMGTAYYFSDRPDRLDKAEDYYRLAVQLRPGDAAIRRNLADVYQVLGKRDEAVHHYREALRLTEEQLAGNPRSPELRLDRALYAAKAGECATAAPLAEQLASELPETARTLHRLAHVHALCGERDAALGAIRAAIRLGISREIIRQEDEFRDLRTVPEFVALTTAGTEPD